MDFRAQRAPGRLISNCGPKLRAKESVSAPVEAEARDQAPRGALAQEMGRDWGQVWALESARDQSRGQPALPFAAWGLRVNSYQWERPRTRCGCLREAEADVIAAATLFPSPKSELAMRGVEGPIQLGGIIGEQRKGLEVGVAVDRGAGVLGRAGDLAGREIDGMDQHRR